MARRLDILGPILLCFDDKVLPCELDVIRYWRFKKVPHLPDVISVHEPFRVRTGCFNWFVDAEARLVFFEEQGRKPKTPSFLKPIFNWTRIYYRLTVPRPVTFEELIGLCKGKHGVGRASIVAAAKKREPNTILTKELFMLEVMGENECLKQLW